MANNNNNTMCAIEQVAHTQQPYFTHSAAIPPTNKVHPTINNESKSYTDNDYSSSNNGNKNNNHSRNNNNNNNNNCNNSNHNNNDNNCNNNNNESQEQDTHTVQQMEAQVQVTTNLEQKSTTAGKSVSKFIGSTLNRLFTWVQSLAFQYYRFALYNLRQANKRRCASCIGIMSCFIVVFMTVITSSALHNLPIIFLRLAENQNGEFDIVVSAAPLASNPLATSLNISAIRKSIQDGVGQLQYNNKYRYHSPRFSFDARLFAAANCTYRGQVLPVTGNLSAVVDWLHNSPNVSDADMDRCFSSNTGCAPVLCSNMVDLKFRAIDAELEAQMDFGKSYPYSTIDEDDVQITTQVAETLKLTVGDHVILQFNTGTALYGPFEASGIIENKRALAPNVVHMVLKVAAILPEKYGKLSAFEKYVAFTSYSLFYKQVAPYLHPRVTAEMRTNLTLLNPYEYAQLVYFNIPPSRTDAYNNNNYDTTQKVITGIASDIFYLLGFDQIATSMPILGYMYGIRFMGLFLGLILNMIITVLTLLSIVLIYSLLMINVETKKFEMGVLRMLGVKRVGIIQLVLMQSLTYGIPGTIAGIIAGVLGYLGISYLLSAIFQTQIRKLATDASVIQGLVLGLVIPVLSSILPIFSALSYNLQESLDSSKSRTQAIIYKIERNSEGISWTPVIIGLCVTIFGFLIYYTFPLSLLSYNFTLMLYMFFGVLLAMLLGLVVLGLNFEMIINKLVAFVFFFWENRALRMLILKNLIAHRIRNRKTTIIYSLTLGFVIFLSVSVNIEVMSFRYDTIQTFGTRLNLVTKSSRQEFNNPLIMQNIENLLKNDPIVSNYTYWTFKMTDVTQISSTSIRNVGGYAYGDQQVRGIPPNFFKLMSGNFLKISAWNPSSYGIDGQLYTRRGSYSLVLGETFYELLGLDARMDTPLIVETRINTDQFPKYLYGAMLPASFLNAAPVASFSYFPDQSKQTALVSLPTFVRMSAGTFSTVAKAPIEKIFVAVKASATNKQIDALKRRITVALQATKISILDMEDELSAFDIPIQVMDFMFLLVTIVAMFMCFFSLFSSMYTNVYEQSKELAILRSIGTTKCFIYRLYIYEAFVLIISASIVGVIVGTCVAYTMVIQQILFTQLPLDFIFPWDIALLVLGLAIVFSLIAALIPTCQLTRLPIVTVLKRLVT